MLRPVRALSRAAWYWQVLVVLVGFALVAGLLAIAIRTWLADSVTVDGGPLTWFEWAEVVGFILAVLGLAITFIQVLKVLTAAEAATVAVDRALSALAKSELLIDYQQMQRLEYELVETAQTAPRSAVQRMVRDVRDVGARLSTVLKNLDSNDPLIGEIEAVRESASQARRVIMGGRKNLNLWSVTRKLRDGLIPLCVTISTRIEELRLDVKSEDADAH